MPALAGMIAFPQFRLQPLGAIAQLGERLHGMQEVVGSSPISSTLKKHAAQKGGVIFLCIHFSWLFFSINLRTLGGGAVRLS